MITQSSIVVETSGRGCYDISQVVQQVVAEAECDIGLCHVFLQHTSASLMICENADPAVLTDVESFLSRLVEDGDAMFTHTAEGPDDMSAHIRSILTQTELTVPVTAGKCALGVWQGIYLYEHRYKRHSRHLTVTVQT